MKKVSALLMSLISISCFALPAESPQTHSNQTNMNMSDCGHAVPLSDPAFCNSFKSVAYCHCTVDHGMPPTACNDMNRLYQIMTTTYGSLWNACSPKVQHETSQQECVDDWNFYNSYC